MFEERSTDRLARYTIFAAITAIICILCWYFRDIIVYILLAAVVSLIGHPIMKLLRRIKVKGKSAPAWILATITLIIILALFLLILTQLIPVVANISSEISIANISDSAGIPNHPINALNRYLREQFPGLGYNFKIENVIGDQLKKVVSWSNVSAVIGSVASVLVNIGVGIFSVLFISFFFIKDENLFSNIVAALVPSTQEKKTKEAIGDIDYLLSRYFIGLIIEVIGVGVLNFLGLSFIAKLSYSGALGIAFITGILNIIPYVGPLTGGIIGTILGLVLKFAAVPSAASPNFFVFTCILVAIFVGTQLVDNFVYQPVIYSNSIKAYPLEIFIVLLIAGELGGILGMLVAIPVYTVLRVIAIRFFGHLKPIRRLIPDATDSEHHIIEQNDIEK